MINEQINILKTEMALVAEMIKESNAAGFNEYGPLLEAFTLHAMEEITGDKFTNLNRLKTNHKGIDLVNDKGTIVIQVTSTADAGKIRHTIAKFEEKDPNTNVSIQDDYPNLQQLIVFGFCSASNPAEFKNPIAPYCEVITRKYFYEGLRNKLDEDAVVRIRDKVRNLSYFDKVHPIRDERCIKMMLQHIDRDAIKHRMYAEGSYADMTKSLSDLKNFINTGKNSNGKIVCKPRSEFNTPQYSDYLDEVHDNISKILRTCNEVKNTRGDPLCFNDDELVKIDAHKQQIQILTTQMRQVLK